MLARELRTVKGGIMNKVLIIGISIMLMALAITYLATMDCPMLEWL